MWAWALWAFPLLCHRGLAVPPAKPENISCILYYKKNFTCTWSPEKEANYTWYRVKRTYTYGGENDICNSTSETPASCSFFPPTITIPDNYTIQVEARNADGTAESNITKWRLDTIVKTEPPMISTVKPVLGIKRMLQINWTRPDLAPASSTLRYTLRFRTVNSSSWTEVSFKERKKENQTYHKKGEKQTYDLTGLQAFTEYEVALRCVAQESTFWSDWGPARSGTTEEEAPLGLHLWRVLEPAREDGKRHVKLLWKNQLASCAQKARGAPALETALSYHIWYFPENATNLTENVSTAHQPLELLLGGEAYQVSVVAQNSVGQSPAATLRIPAADEKACSAIEDMQTSLSGDQLVVTWQSSAPNVDSWMVEWIPDLDPEPSLCWELVSGARNWTLRQDKSASLWCYNISVYPLVQDRVGQPRSVQAYVREGVPLAGPVTRAENIGVKSVTITWTEIPKRQRRGFIRNYTVFYRAEDGEEFSKTVSASTLRCGLEALARGTSYTVRVMASTSAGSVNGTGINFKTLSISVPETCLIAVLVGGGLLVLAVLAAAYGLRKPNKLKHLCWPEVPTPARSSLAAWRGQGLKVKLNPKEVDDAMNTEEDRILKPCPAPSHLIDKLVVNFENFLEEVSAEESGKGQENILGGDKNEYVTSPFGPYCVPGDSFLEPPTAAEAPPTAAETPPTATEAPPTATEAPPTAAEALSTAAEALSTAAEALPTAAGAPPTAAEALSTAAEVSPTAAEALSTAAEVSPTAAEALSTVPEALSTAPEAPPTAAEVSPTAPEAPPTAAGAPPTAAEVSPTAAEALSTAAMAPPTVPEAPPTAAEVSPTAAGAPPTAAEAPPTAAGAPPTAAEAPPTAAGAPPRKPQHLCSASPAGTCPEAEEQSPGPAHVCGEGAPNPYLKNSVTTREFLVSESLPDQTKSAI